MNNTIYTVGDKVRVYHVGDFEGFTEYGEYLKRAEAHHASEPTPFLFLVEPQKENKKFSVGEKVIVNQTGFKPYITCVYDSGDAAFPIICGSGRRQENVFTSDGRNLPEDEEPCLLPFSELALKSFECIYGKLETLNLPNQVAQNILKSGDYKFITAYCSNISYTHAADPDLGEICVIEEIKSEVGEGLFADTTGKVWKYVVPFCVTNGEIHTGWEEKDEKQF